MKLDDIGMAPSGLPTCGVVDPEVYDLLLHAAAAVSDPLRAVIARIGPIAVAPPTHASIADRLFVEVVNQQLSTKAALAIWTRVEAAASRVGVPLRDLFVPEYVAVLRACGVSGNKVRALHAIREVESAGRLGPDLAMLPHAERSKVLCGIRGVGQWTADMIGIFHCLDHDIWPVGDVAAVGTLRRLSGLDDTLATAAAFAPYRSILARYMWRSRDASSVAEQAA